MFSFKKTGTARGKRQSVPVRQHKSIISLHSTQGPSKECIISFTSPLYKPSQAPLNLGAIYPRAREARSRAEHNVVAA